MLGDVHIRKHSREIYAMKDLFISLMILPILLPALAEADSRDEIDRLKMQVEMLTDQVAKLRSEVNALKLERKVPRTGGATIASGTSAAGSYVLDTADIEKIISRMALQEHKEYLESADAGKRKQMLALILKEARQQATTMKMDVVLHNDGTFDTRGRFQGEALSAIGKWTQTGDEIEILTTSEGGVTLTEPVRKVARLENGNLVFPPDDQLVFEMVLRRK